MPYWTIHGTSPELDDAFNVVFLLLHDAGLGAKSFRGESIEPTAPPGDDLNAVVEKLSEKLAMNANGAQQTRAALVRRRVNNGFNIGAFNDVFELITI